MSPEPSWSDLEQLAIVLRAALWLWGFFLVQMAMVGWATRDVRSPGDPPPPEGLELWLGVLGPLANGAILLVPASVLASRRGSRFLAVALPVVVGWYLAAVLGTVRLRMGVVLVCAGATCVALLLMMLASPADRPGAERQATRTRWPLLIQFVGVVWLALAAKPANDWADNHPAILVLGIAVSAALLYYVVKSWLALHWLARPLSFACGAVSALVAYACAFELLELAL